MEGSGFKGAAALATAVGVNLNYFHGRGWGCSDQGSSPCCEPGRALQINLLTGPPATEKVKNKMKMKMYGFPNEFKKWGKVASF